MLVLGVLAFMLVACGKREQAAGEGAAVDAGSVRPAEAPAGESPIPQIVTRDGRHALLVDGEPLPEPVADNPTGEDRGGTWVFALFVAFVVGQFARAFFGRLPAGIRALFGGGASGAVAWLVSSVVLVGGIGAVLGFFLGLASGGGGGRYARHHGWGGYSGGGGGWGGGSSGGSSGGGWSGGGGMSGGGGASGGW